MFLLKHVLNLTVTLVCGFLYSGPEIEKNMSVCACVCVAAIEGQKRKLAVTALHT